MKYLFLILLILPSCTKKDKVQLAGHGQYNVLVGRNVGFNSSIGSFNVVFSDSTNSEIEKNIPAGSYWYVDTQCLFLADNPELKEYLSTISNFNILQEDRKIEIFKKIQELIEKPKTCFKSTHYQLSGLNFTENPNLGFSPSAEAVLVGNKNTFIGSQATRLLDR